MWTASVNFPHAQSGLRCNTNDVRVGVSTNDASNMSAVSITIRLILGVSKIRLQRIIATRPNTKRTVVVQQNSSFEHEPITYRLTTSDGYSSFYEAIAHEVLASDELEASPKASSESWVHKVDSSINNTNVYPLSSKVFIMELVYTSHDMRAIRVLHLTFLVHGLCSRWRVPVFGGRDDRGSRSGQHLDGPNLLDNGE